MLRIIKKAARIFFAPVEANPLFFTAIVVLGTTCVITEAAFIGNFRKWIALYDVMQSAVWGYVMSWVVYRWDKRWLKSVFIGVWGVAALIEVVHYSLIGFTVDAQSVSLVLDTNTREAGGFLLQFFTPWLTAGAVIGLAAVIALARAVGRSRIRVKRMKPAWAALTLVLVAGGVVRLAQIAPMTAIDHTEDFTMWMSHDNGNGEIGNYNQMVYADPIVKGVYIAKSISLEKEVYDKWAALQSQLFAESDMARHSDNDSLRIVVIIGESFIKSHSSLYGYHLQVNPHLERERSDSALVVFTDMITPGNYTTIAITNLMNLNRLGATQPSQSHWWQSAYFPLVFKKAGWRVSMFTNQYDPHSRTSELGRMFFDPFIVTTCYDAYNRYLTPYDGDFVKDMTADHALDKPEGNAGLTIWHLKGQHFPAGKYFPDDITFKRFTIEDVPDDKPWLDADKRQEVADYANATLYNDSVVASIIDLYRSTDAVVIYFSDHGEEMWDTAPAGARNKQSPEDASWMHRQFDVPFVVWMSEPFRRHNPDLTRRIRQAADRPGSLDDLGQMVLELGGIESKHLRPEASIISDSYRPVRRVSAQGYAYPD